MKEKVGTSALRDADVEALTRELIERLGGAYAAVEQITGVLEADESSGDGVSLVTVDEGTPGYCYLRLFDRVEHRDALVMGAYPTVADLRRFSNRRVDPFGTRTVVVVVCNVDGNRVAHVEYRGGDAGLRPVSALAALSKDLRVGGLPDGVSDSFPESWIPADLTSVVTWDFVLAGTTDRSLDALGWIGDYPAFLRRRFEPVSAVTSRLRWNVKANPLGPNTATIDVIDPKGKVMTVRQWSSYVAHTGYHQQWRVRGNKVYVELELWRAAKMLSDPTSPAPSPTPGGGHGELFSVVAGGSATHGLHVVPVVEEGYCYASAFRDRRAAMKALGKCPTVEKIIQRGTLLGSEGKAHGTTLLFGENGLHHAENRGEAHSNFWTALATLDPGDRVGATQGVAVVQDSFENINSAPVLALRPKSAGMVVNIPFVCVLDGNKSRLLWDITRGQKLNTLMSYFESVELVSLHVKVTVHKGDNDTLVSVIADTMETWLSEEEDWVGAAHTLHVSGNTNGATSGEFKLEGNHGFGTQLKGVSVGNPTPIVQVKLETTVSATAYLKAMLNVRVSGTGIPKAMVLSARPAKGGLNGSAG